MAAALSRASKAVRRNKKPECGGMFDAGDRVTKTCCSRFLRRIIGAKLAEALAAWRPPSTRFFDKFDLQCLATVTTESAQRAPLEGDILLQPLLNLMGRDRGAETNLQAKSTKTAGHIKAVIKDAIHLKVAISPTEMASLDL